MDETVIKLTKPITAYNEEISELKLREPLYGDFVKVGKYHENPAEMTARLLSVIGNIPYSSIEKMNLKDGMKAQSFLTPFMKDLEIEENQS